MLGAWNCGNLKQGELGVVRPSSSEKSVVGAWSKEAWNSGNLGQWDLGAKGTCSWGCLEQW